MPGNVWRWLNLQCVFFIKKRIFLYWYLGSWDIDAKSSARGDIINVHNYMQLSSQYKRICGGFSPCLNGRGSRQSKHAFCSVHPCQAYPERVKSVSLFKYLMAWSVDGQGCGEISVCVCVCVCVCVWESGRVSEWDEGGSEVGKGVKFLHSFVMEGIQQDMTVNVTFVALAGKTTLGCYGRPTPPELNYHEEFLFVRGMKANQDLHSTQTDVIFALDLMDSCLTKPTRTYTHTSTYTLLQAIMDKVTEKAQLSVTRVSVVMVLLTLFSAFWSRSSVISTYSTFSVQTAGSWLAPTCVDQSQVSCSDHCFFLFLFVSEVHHFLINDLVHKTFGPAMCIGTGLWGSASDIWNQTIPHFPDFKTCRHGLSMLSF